MISRRQFLTRALASVPVVLAGEQLAELLAPRKSIFLPPRGGWGTLNPLDWDNGGWIAEFESDDEILPIGDLSIVRITLAYGRMPRKFSVADTVIIGDTEWPA